MIETHVGCALCRAIAAGLGKDMGGKLVLVAYAAGESFFVGPGEFPAVYLSIHSERRLA